MVKGRSKFYSASTKGGDNGPVVLVVLSCSLLKLTDIVDESIRARLFVTGGTRRSLASGLECKSAPVHIVLLIE